ncbi:MAG: hypothetical protein FJ404_05185 [Verrucomicrobia bacterium]|nr:hypothetical protein [Verrucomicrobiota bacterium]
MHPRHQPRPYRDNSSMIRLPSNRACIMRAGWLSLALSLANISWVTNAFGAQPSPAPQRFRQEIALHHQPDPGKPSGPIQCLDAPPSASLRVFASGRWWQQTQDRWSEIASCANTEPDRFRFPGPDHQPLTVGVPWGQVRQLLRQGESTLIATADSIQVHQAGGSELIPLPGPSTLHQIALGPGNTLHAATSRGLFKRVGSDWKPMTALDAGKRAWGTDETLGVGFDGKQRLWFCTSAGIARATDEGWEFLTPAEGLPWNQFTGIAFGPASEAWFATRLGVIRLDESGFHYRQGPRWLPHDHVRQVVVDSNGTAWMATESGLGAIARRSMTLAEKAEHYESEIEKYVKRTPLGYVAEARLQRPADKSSAHPDDSDNDGLWTSMYGAGQCFAYAATKDPQSKARAGKAFTALRFLQKVTQGGPHAPPHGYVARTVRSTSLPDPNAGRLEADREMKQRHDRLWKVYAPRWPRSADGQWFWKGDTSSDELDGHYFFYPLYYDFCADTESEKARVREVVRDLTDHLVRHGFNLVDHDGQPTRWGVFSPEQLNHNKDWMIERGLNSLSMLSYLAVAEHVTGDAKYGETSKMLIERHHYDQNAVVPKIQMGTGSGNQSDDEMAFMSFYSLFRYSKNAALREKLIFAFYGSWALEQPEMNPFFHFAYAGHAAGAKIDNPFGSYPLAPWDGWHQDSMATLYGFPLDRLNWPHKNSHRLDLQWLEPQRSVDIYEPRKRTRGFRGNGKVLPVENRHFNHWNTDPWQLDYGGSAHELASGTVFLLPYYMGLYHGFIEKP